MKVLVTGGAGFIGSHVVDLLIEKGHETIVVDNLVTGYREFVPSGARFYKLDIESSQLEIVFAIENPEIVIHLAAQVDVAKSIKNPLEDARSNIIGTLNLLTFCQKYKVKKIIYSSSCAVYGDANMNRGSIRETYPTQPLNFYGASKYAPELYIQIFHHLYGIPYTILRYANVYGPRQTPKGEGGVVSIFTTKLLKGEQPNIFGDGNQTRDFIYVKDVAASNVRAVEVEKGKNRVLNVGNNTRTSINRLYQMITASMSVKISPIYFPKREGDIQDSCLDNKSVMLALNWKPEYDLQEGLTETIKYFHESRKF